MAGAWALALVFTGVACRLLAASARELQFFDVADIKANLHAPKPPALGEAPSVATKAVFLADGSTSARPMAYWDVAVLRDYHAKNGAVAAAYVTLARLDGSAFYHLELHKGAPASGRIATGGTYECSGCRSSIDRSVQSVYTRMQSTDVLTSVPHTPTHAPKQKQTSTVMEFRTSPSGGSP